jgi:transcription elongation factor S-II
MNATRKFAVDKFAETLEVSPDDARVVNLEKSILNHTCDRFPEDERTFENLKFGEAYKLKFLEIRRNLQRNPELCERLKNKTIKTHTLIDMKPWQAVPDGIYAKTREERIHKELRKEFLAREAQNQTGFFRCGKCKSYKTSYYQLQTRSADEPMTTFVSCLNCNNNFKV